MPILAGKPAQYFILPDPLRPSFAASDATPEAGAYAGPTIEGDARGFLVPVQSGEVAEGALDREYVLVQGGGPDVAEFVQRADGAANYLGRDDPRAWWGYHTPITASPGCNNSACAYDPGTRSIFVYAVNSGSTVGKLFYRNVDTARYDVWTDALTTSGSDVTLTNAAASGEHGAALLSLPDGRLLLVQRIDGITGTPGPTIDFDVYQCESPGLGNWTLVSSRIILRGNPSGTFPTHRTAAQVRIARSGEYLRLVWADNTTPGLLHSWVSRDRGITWRPLGDGPTLRELADLDDRVPFDVLGVDDSGTFLLVGLVSTSTTTIGYWRASGEEDWATGAALTTVIAGNVRSIALGLAPSYLYAFVFYSDMTTGVTDGWTMLRAPRTSVGWFDVLNASGAGWQVWSTGASRISGYSGVDQLPSRIVAVWAGPSWFLHGARKSEFSGVDSSTGAGWYAEGWTERSAGQYGPSQNWATTNAILWGGEWNAPTGRPSDGAGTAWTQTTVGTGTDTTTPDTFEITGSAAGDQRYYEIAGPANTWYADGFALEFVIRLDTGDSRVLSDDVAVRIIAADTAGLLRRDVSIRVGPVSVRAFDRAAGGVAAATLTGLTTDTGAGGAYHRVRFSWGVNGTNAQIAAYNTATGVWSESTTFTAASQATASSSSIRWGHLGQNQADQMRSWWREFRFSTDARTMNFSATLPLPATTREDAIAALFGSVASSAPTYVADGLSVAWAGLGGARGDLFYGQIAHTYAVESVAVDSPRIAWRSIDTASTSSLILWTGRSSAFHRWRHDAIAVVATNCRTITVDYDDDPLFGSPTASETLNTTAYGTGTTPLTVASIDGNTITITTPAGGWPFVRGELVGRYVRVTSGAASGQTWKVTRHGAQAVVQFDDETTLGGLLAGDSFVVFGGPGAFALRYSAARAGAYMRLRFTDTNTAEGYHTVGTVVAGRALPIDVPIDWAWTDDQQPNVTSYRTRSGIGWAFAEGPSQRTISGRIVGDAERWRDAFRAMFEPLAYESRPVVLVLDEDRTAEQAVFGRVKSGGSLDNAAWYVDATGRRRVAGDLSITFVEEV